MLPASLLVLLSGAASLMYQVVWTRRLVSVTSATVTAQAVVLASFMAGLGLGAALAGRFAARARRPALGYAAAELGAAVLAVVSMPVIARADALRLVAADLGLSLAAGVWVELAGLSLFLVLPATLLGASLPFMLEHVERRRRAKAGGFVGALYGLNTLGAAAGTLASGFWTVETFGLSRTIALAAAIGATAAVGAAVLGLLGADTPPPPRDPGPDPAPTVEPALLLAAAIGGFVGLGAEVLWTRLVSLVVFTTVYAFSEVLLAVLIGIAAGAGVAAVVARAFRTSPAGRGESPTAVVSHFAALAAVLLALFPVLLAELAAASSLRVEYARGASFGANLLLIALLSPAAAAIAAILPLLVSLSKVTRSATSFGFLYGANTAGSVLGSLATGFVLLPIAGSTGTNLLLVAAALVLAALVLRLGPPRPSPRILVAAAATAALLLAAVRLPLSLVEPHLADDERILDFEEGSTSHVMVTGLGPSQRRLWINSAWVANTAAEGEREAPHRMLGHLPALLVATPRRGLGVALGTGQTFEAVLTHGVNEFHAVEIDAGVLRLSALWFGEANQGLLTRREVHVHNDDGRAYMRSTSAKHDVIVLEPLQAWSAGTSNLYTREFYEEARRVLADDGVLAQWIPFYGQSADDTRSMVRSAIEVFETASLWLDNNDGILILGRGAMGPVDLAQRARAHGVMEQLRASALADGADLMSLLLLGSEGLARWTEGAPVLTDDWPFLEFRAARAIGASAPKDSPDAILASTLPFLEPIAHLTWSGTSTVTARAEQVRAAWMDERRLDERAFAARAEVLERGLAEAPGSALLRAKYRELVLGWATAPEVQGRGPRAVEAVYQRALTHDPEQGEVLVNLALLLMRTGRAADASAVLARARAVERVRPVADELLAALTSTAARAVPR